MSEPRLEAVIFDLFGTLVYEMPRSEFFGSIREIASMLEADPEAFVAVWEETMIERQTGWFPTLRENLEAICRRLGVTPPEGAMERALEVRARAYQRWFQPRPGAAETLTELRRRGYALGLVSMCAPDTPALWRSSRLAGLVDAEVFSCEVGLRKPDPAIYLLACELMGVDASRCLYCGDGAYRELSGAAAVGMTPYLIADPDLNPEELLVPEAERWDGPEVTDLRELLSVLPVKTPT